MKTITDSDEERFKQARRLLKAEKYEEALPAFEALASRYPDEPKFFINAGFIHFETGRLELAELRFREAVRLKPVSDLFSRLLYRALWDQEKFDDAFEEMKRFIRLGGRSEDYDAIIDGFIRIQKEKDEEAIGEDRMVASHSNEKFPSPNFGSRPTGVSPSYVILHYTEMPLRAARARLCDPATEVSAHWLIGRQGGAEQLVAEEARAWHAGVSAWGPHDNFNDVSIGIELVNLGPPGGSPPFPERQMAALEALLRQMMKRWGIPARNVLAHSDIAPTRKEDPGVKFDWRRLARQGLSIWADPTPSGPPTEDGAAILSFQRAAAGIGYRVESTGAMDEQTRAVLTAFQRRFRPFEPGAPLSSEAVEQAESLAALTAAA